MEANNSLIPQDAQARVRSVFRQQLQTFIDMQYAPRDPHERFAEHVNELELVYEACPHRSSLITVRIMRRSIIKTSFPDAMRLWSNSRSS